MTILVKNAMDEEQNAAIFYSYLTKECLTKTDSNSYGMAQPIEWKVFGLDGRFQREAIWKDRMQIHVSAEEVEEIKTGVLQFTSHLHDEIVSLVAGVLVWHINSAILLLQMALPAVHFLIPSPFFCTSGGYRCQAYLQLEDFDMSFILRGCPGEKDDSLSWPSPRHTGAYSSSNVHLADEFLRLKLQLNLK